MIQKMEMENYIYPMVKFLKENLKMILFGEKEFY